LAKSETAVPQCLQGESTMTETFQSTGSKAYEASTVSPSGHVSRDNAARILLLAARPPKGRAEELKRQRQVERTGKLIQKLLIEIEEVEKEFRDFEALG
jgi:hypothetical protein